MMTKQTVSIDFDGVLMKLTLGKVWKRKPTHSIKNKDGLWQIFDVLENSWMEFIQMFKPMLPGADGGLNYLNKKYRVVLITSRSKNVIPATEKWLKRWNLRSYFEKLNFNVDNQLPEVYKTESLLQNQSSIHIDDDFKTVLKLSDSFPDKKIVYLNYYKNEPIKRKNVVEINGWNEIEKVI